MVVLENMVIGEGDAVVVRLDNQTNIEFRIGQEGQDVACVTLNADRTVTVHGETYASAVAFWDCLARVMSPYGWELKPPKETNA